VRIQVLGQGAWGRALANLLESNGHLVQRWSRDMPAVWMKDLELVVLAVPSRFVEEVLIKFVPPHTPVVSCVKGMEPEKNRMIHEIVWEVWAEARFVVLSGPNFAEEISSGKPAAAVCASTDEMLARAVQQVFNQPNYRVYVSLDPLGVQLGGALKNVYALAAGACAALGYGENAEAALVTRSLAEMSRVGVALGGKVETFMGLSGVGDLFLTCYSDKSRNRRFGKFLAMGKSFRETLGLVGGIAEGVTTVRALRERCKSLGLPAPIVESIYSAIYLRRSLELVIRELLETIPDLESREEMGIL